MTERRVNWLDGHRARVNRRLYAAEQRTRLTAGQHVLHLLLSVFTGGLWLPVWFVRAQRGNPPLADRD